MGDSRNYVERLVEMMGEGSVFAFILANGREFQPDAGTFRGRRRTLKQCFMNATRMTTRDSSLTYVEGYVTTLIPIHHAWLLEPDGTNFGPDAEGGGVPAARLLRRPVLDRVPHPGQCGQRVLRAARNA